MTDNITIPRALLEQALDALQQSTPKQRTGEDEYAERGFKEHYAAMTALQSALEQPQEDPELLKDKTWEERKCKQCGDVLMSSFTQLCYGCKQEGMQ